MLYTDGLIERRGEDIRVGLDRLLKAAQRAPLHPDDMSDYIMSQLLSKHGSEDDAAVVCVTMADQSPDRDRE